MCVNVGRAGNPVKASLEGYTGTETPRGPLEIVQTPASHRATIRTQSGKGKGPPEAMGNREHNGGFSPSSIPGLRALPRTRAKLDRSLFIPLPSCESRHLHFTGEAQRGGESAQGHTARKWKLPLGPATVLCLGPLLLREVESRSRVPTVVAGRLGGGNLYFVSGFFLSSTHPPT